jgi:hypothetical protein
VAAASDLPTNVAIALAGQPPTPKPSGDNTGVPRVVAADSGELFDRARSELVAIARSLVGASLASFKQIGATIDAECSEASARESIQASAKQHFAFIAAQSGGKPFRGPAVPPKRGEFGLDLLARKRALVAWLRVDAGDEVRGARLSKAYQQVSASNRENDPLRSLGNNLPSGEREINARRALLLGLAIADPDADQYLGEVLDLARAPWRSTTTPGQYVLGRSEVLLAGGRELLGLLDEAITVLQSSQDKGGQGGGTSRARAAGVTLDENLPTKLTATRLAKEIRRSRTTVNEWRNLARIPERARNQPFTKGELRRLADMAEKQHDDNAAAKLRQLAS